MKGFFETLSDPAKEWNDGDIYAYLHFLAEELRAAAAPDATSFQTKLGIISLLGVMDAAEEQLMVRWARRMPEIPACTS